MSNKLQNVEVWISGPQGTGKTIAVNALKDYFADDKLPYRIVEEGEIIEQSHTADQLSAMADAGSRRPLWTVRMSNFEPETFMRRALYEKKPRAHLRIEVPAKPYPPGTF